MRWHSVVLAAGTLALSLVACSDHPSAAASDDAEREHIVQRALALQMNVEATGRISTEQRRELEEIKHDIETWQERTGRTDLSVSSSRPVPTDGTAALISKGPSTSCPPCPPVKVIGTMICFLVDGWCAPTSGLVRGCVYTCIST
jgi:hypothetical protein